MKKVIAFVALVVCFSVTTAMAQGGGAPQQMTPEQRAVMMKERLTSLNLSAVQSDSAVAVFGDRSIMQSVYGTADFRSMTPEDRTVKNKEINDIRQKRLEKIMSADLAKKVIEALSQRPGGGRPGGGGK